MKHQHKFFCRLFTTATVVLFGTTLAACGDQEVPSPAEPSLIAQKASNSVAAPATITDRTPRPQMPLDHVLAALEDATETDGTVLVGVKEAGAVRGVSVRGVQLPLVTRRAAEQAIRQTVPDLNVVLGISRAVNWRSAQGVMLDTIHRTYINVRMPHNLAALRALRNHPNVDYIVPNYTNAVLRAIRSTKATTGRGIDDMTSLPMATTEYVPWGVQTVRAPGVWDLGYVGENVPFYIVDTGFDSSIGYGTEHPDFVFNKALNSYVGSHPEDPCQSTSQRCFWESPFHGSGVMGMAVGQRNGIAAVGVAPRQHAV